MFKLLYLRALVKTLRGAIALSDKLPTRIWVGLCLIFALLLSLSVAGLFAYSQPRTRTYFVLTDVTR